MQPTIADQKSELYSIFAEGLKKPTIAWVDWYNNQGKQMMTELLGEISFPQIKEVLESLPGKLDITDLKRLYIHSFILPGPHRVVPVESVYKIWSEEKSALNFASSKGYLMGDAAIHMNYLFKELGIDIPEEFQLSPDHLILQLELLSLLEEGNNHTFIQEFIKEHLNWTGYMMEECNKKHWSGFYYDWLRLIHLFFEKRCWG
jgi:TorA maturation chaperone TorD